MPSFAMPGYLEHLAVRMAVQAAQLPESLRNLHREFALQKQNPDGGFAGRDGESDLYYTSFGLRVLSMLGALYGEPAEKSAAYLHQCLQGRESVVDFLTLIYSAALLDMSAGLDVFESAASGWQQRILEQLESFRRPDGGYAKGPQGAAGSTYHSFLVVICQQLLQAPTPQPEHLAQFLLSQRDETGGFREIRAAKRGSTNPSAAAIAVLKILDCLDESVAAEAIAFLAQMQNEEGGLRANTRIPIADVLSTFTGLQTLQDLGGLDAVDTKAMRRYVQSLESAAGGFYAAAWDQAVDVEYTFYGLGALSILGVSR